MNSRERIRCALEHREPDRVPIHDTLWEATITRWNREGLPCDIPADDYFGYEIARVCPDLGPQLGCEVLEENEEYIIQRNLFGETVKNHCDRSTTPQVIDSPVKSRKDWDSIKDRLVADDRRLISLGRMMNPESYVGWNKALADFQREQRKGRFIAYTAIIGYDLVQRYVGSERLLVAIATEPEWVKEMYTVNAELIIEMCELKK